MSDRKIDFSVIDPQRDPDRWNRQVEATAARALARRKGSAFVFSLLESARPALLLAASVALVTWCGVTVRHGSTMESGADDAAWVLTRWAVTGEEPSVASMLEVLGAEPQ
jgi:sirohydrochlorin ferrochelatase